MRAAKHWPITAFSPASSSFLPLSTHVTMIPITLTEKTVKREHYHNPNVAADELTQDLIHFD